MLPAGSIDKKILARQQNADIYNSCVTVSLGLDCPLSYLGLNEEHIFLTRSDISRSEHQSPDPRKSEISIIPISYNDPTLAPPGQGAITISTPSLISHHDHWKTKTDSNGNYVRKTAYRDFKRAFADILVKRVEDYVVPDLRKHIVILDIATPITYHRYTGNRNGAMMGFRPSTRNFRNRLGGYSTPIENLFVGGQWAELGGGVPNTVKAAVNSSLIIMQRENPEAFRALSEVVDGHTSNR